MQGLTLTVTQMAAELGVSRPTAYQILRRADFDAAFKIGTRTVISRDRLAAWVDRQCRKQEDRQ